MIEAVPLDLELDLLFEKINQEHFDGFLDPPILQWNPRLRTCSGRFIPGIELDPRNPGPTIEIASYLREQLNALALVQDTLAHEMIHYWLWVRGRPHGHTEEFEAKMHFMGVSRYNPIPRKTQYRYVYRCEVCDKAFLSGKRLGRLACEACCRVHAEGRFDSRFQLVLAERVRVGAI